MNQAQIFKYNNLSLEYKVFKGGDNALLAFHGFGKSMDDMDVFHGALKGKYTIYAFNFFHHGNSVYPKDRIKKNTLTAIEWNELMNLFLEQNQIKKFSLFGYSMGGKLCLEMIPYFKTRVKNVYLLAPDGLKNNFWYSLTSRNKIGNSIYRGIIKNPKPFFTFIGFLRIVRILNKNLYRFTKFNLATREQRQLVYDVWMTMRHINPNLKNIAKIINENKINIYMLFGVYDKIIPVSLAKRLTKRTENTTKVYEISCGHNMFNNDTSNTLSEIITKAY